MWYDSGTNSGIGGISSSGTSGIGGILCSGIGEILQPDSGTSSRFGGISSPGPGVNSGSECFPLALGLVRGRAFFPFGPFLPCNS